MKFFAVVFLTSCFGFAVIVKSIQIKCTFGTLLWSILGSHYNCHLHNQGDIILDWSNRKINAVTGSHDVSKTIVNVKAFEIENSNCFYFPLELEKFFRNLEGIFIFRAKFKEITQEDLKKLIHLKEINIEGNEIDYVEPNLFQFNPKLEFIGLKHNKITHIDTHVFDIFVGKLRFLNLGGNICQLENAENNKTKANEIIGEIRRGVCQDEIKKPQKNLISIQFEELKKIIEELRVEIKGELNAVKENLEITKSGLEAQLKTFTEEISDFKANSTYTANEIEQKVTSIGNMMGLNEQP